jgi:hypothetical protein
MPISMGIICEKCGIVYLITTRASNQHINCLPRTAGPGMFSLKCSCGATRSFHKNDLKPYSVSTDVLARGFAKGGEYSVQQDPARIPFSRNWR